MGLEFPLWLTRLRTQHNVHEDVGSIPGLTQGVKDPGLDPVLPWLLCRPEAAALDSTPAQGFPYAIGIAVKRKKKIELLFNVQVFF